MDKNKEKEKALLRLKKVLKEELYKCIRCGECRTVCPVYGEKQAERYTARGKMLIISGLANGELKFTKEVRESLENCLLCASCVNKCTSNVDSNKVVAAARQAFAQELGLPNYKKALCTIMKSQKIMDNGMKVASLSQSLMFKKIPQMSGMYRRFSMPMIDEHQYIPAVTSNPFRQRKQKYEAQGTKKVSYFIGCMTNYCMPEIAESVVFVLNKMGVSVEVPQGQGCCAMPMLASGDKQSIEEAGSVNLQAFGNSDEPIVVACASCGHMLKSGYKEMLGDDPKFAEKVEKFSKRIVDINEYLLREFTEEEISSRVKYNNANSVTYHDPCHLRKGQNIFKEPRTILSIASSDSLIEMEGADSCCGLGGTYTIAHLKTSKDIQSHKLENALETRAQTLTSSCPGCLLQLNDGVRRHGKGKMQVKHAIQVLAESFGQAHSN